MRLELLHGKYRAENVVNVGAISLAKVDGKWYALNHRSTDPVLLRSRDYRTAWARPQGITSKDVESYVRREKARAKRERLSDALLDAQQLLSANGYIVTDSKGNVL